ncbi:MAG: Na-K-Cl cotransporter [candidate division Zixibacteria bacterium]|nr:Na-K-Cl cotransporter [candidate division Zixibacteria bacterium]MBU1470129.1 Na-K-Cl cotransporter [candidate division Zixibacteria bacterium]
MEQNTKGELGTFLGVYTPTILTILGVIMYLRFGWIVGNLGLVKTLVIVVAANLITLVTTLSFSSMATNMRVGGGGAYFIISRSLGLGIGAAIGIPLFLSQAVSITLYSYGLAEALGIIWPAVSLLPACIIIILVVTAVSLYGARFALKTQVPLLILVGISLVALAIGAATIMRSTEVPIAVEPMSNIDFWYGFAVFFPAVTGVMAGLSLSGDLKNPTKAIPFGAIAATLTGFAVYMIIPILLFFSATAEQLQTDALIWLKIAPFSVFLILPGLWGAILSSAVGSVLGAPRTLQAIVRDQVSKQSVRSFVSGNAGIRVALLLSASIAIASVFLGDLNAVAQVVTMFFLTVYGTINIVAGLESLSGDPSWRPRFRIPWFVNIACGLACLWVMFLISPLASVVAIAIEIFLWLFFARREQRATWGDARRGLYEAVLRWALIRLSRRSMSARNWRPHVLVFVDDARKKLDLIKFASWFSQNRGVVTVCELVVGDLLQESIDTESRQQTTTELMLSEDLTVFVEVDVVDNVVHGIVDVSQANGIAGFASNTIVLGWPKDPNRLAEFIVTARRLERIQKSVIIGKINPQHIFPIRKASREIHVWWGGLKQNGDLMLLLAYLLTRNPEWRGTELKIMCAASNEFSQQNTVRYLESLLKQIRIDAECDVFIRPEGVKIGQLIQERSADADAVFLGLAVPEPGEELNYAHRLEGICGDLPVVFFVKNSCVFVGELLEPDELEPE